MKVRRLNPSPAPPPRPLSLDLSPPPHNPTSTPARLRQRPRCNCSPAWPASPRCCLLCSRRLPELLHASVRPAPPRRLQLQPPPSYSPPPDRCPALTPLPRPPAPTPSIAARPSSASPRPAPGRPWTLPLASLGRSSTRLSPPAGPRRRPPPLAAAQLLGHPTRADGSGCHRPGRLLWTPPAA
jgi:hypothetical protein